MNTGAADQPTNPAGTRSASRGASTRGGPPGWTAWTITPGTDGTTVLHGAVVDQSALHGVLARVRDIGLPLISVARVEPDPAPHTTPPDTSTGV